MARPDSERSLADTRWIDRIARLAGAFGFSETQVRWRLLRWQARAEEDAKRPADTLRHVGYAHSLCPECGRILPRGTKTCPGCEARVGTRAEQLVRRLGLQVPKGLSAGLFLGTLIVFAYARQSVVSGSWTSPGGQALLALGSHYVPLELAGQWWRLGTAVFLHGGLMHVAFNLFALMQVAPAMEELFGRGRTLYVYMATGVLAFLPSVILGSQHQSIGASGAIMGLIGALAAWGHRDGTSVGLAVRGRMVRWLLYTLVIGFFLRGDFLAHVGGFVAGAAFGWFAPRNRSSHGSAADAILGTVAALAAIACVVLVFLGPRITGIDLE